MSSGAIGLLNSRKLEEELVASIAIVGTGYVGLTTGACFAEMGHSVCCFDVDVQRIHSMQVGVIPIYEPGMEELVAQNVAAGRLRFSSDRADALQGAQFVFICVGTPTAADGSGADLQYVHAAAADIARTLRAPAILVNKSTSPIGTADSISWILEELRPELAPWSVVSNPEFLREGSAIIDCLNPTRVVLGARDQGAAEAVADLYRGLGCPIITTDLPSAEMIKYASNAFLAMRISFINEVAQICDAFGADVTTVAHGMGLDTRIGPSFLQAGLGFGGSCFPKDVAALAHMAAGAQLHPQLLRAVIDINRHQREWALDQLEKHLGSLENRTVAIWGLAFKPNTDDLREAPALDIISMLADRGASVRAYDPVAGDAAKRRNVPATICDSSLEAIVGADALLIATDWSEFKTVTWTQVRDLMCGTLVFDGRNCIDPCAISSSGLRYIGVGRMSGNRFLGKARHSRSPMFVNAELMAAG